jgi:diaminopimelate epimerase
MKRALRKCADGFPGVSNETPESNEPVGELEEKELYPYGCAKLRMSEMTLLKQKRKENAMKLDFIKMHGCGNDYIYIDCFKNDVEEPEKLAQILSDRHFSVGGDGVILVCPSDIADARMRMFNADGSEGKMCGNGVRCVAKFVYDNGLCRNDPMRIETLSGIKTLELSVDGGKVRAATVGMGKAETQRERTLHVGGCSMTLMPVSVGNPHAVIFTQDAENAPLETLGPKIEHHPEFPDGVNVEFVQVLSQTEMRMRVWERGSGVTMACGTGSCASAAAAVRKGLCKPNVPIAVHLDGGTLHITVGEDGSVTMTGPAETVYEGETV